MIETDKLSEIGWVYREGKYWTHRYIENYRQRKKIISEEEAMKLKKEIEEKKQKIRAEKKAIKEEANKLMREMLTSRTEGMQAFNNLRTRLLKMEKQGKIKFTDKAYEQLFIRDWDTTIIGRIV